MPILERIARRWSRLTGCDAEDLLQEAILCVLSKLERFPSDIREPTHYLVKCAWIAVRAAASGSRSGRNALSLDMPLSTDSKHTLADTIAVQPEPQADRRSVEALYEAIDDLVPYLKETLAIFYHLDITAQRQVRSANRTKNTLEAYHSRAMQKLRNNQALREAVCA